jgi:microcystin-dependent protein
MAEPYLGEIRMFGGDFAPRGWARCHGQLLPICEHAPLFSLIGTTYGGDGVDTFALPDLRHDGTPTGSLPITFIIALAGVYPPRP